MTAILGRDAEGLLQQPVRFVAVAVGAFVQVLIAVAGLLSVDALRARTGRPLGGGCCGRLREAAALSFHFSVCQEAAGNAAGAPRFSIGPPPHAGLSLVPDEDGAGSDLLALLLGEAALNARENSQATGLEEHNGILRSADLAVVRFHAGHDDAFVVQGFGPRGWRGGAQERNRGGMGGLGGVCREAGDQHDGE
jgi:hypothetical protein